MIYKVPLSKLKKIANPFEQVAFEDTAFPIETEQIKAAINSNNIFEDINESALQNHIRKIAYLVSNYDSKIIHINLDSNASGWIVEKGSEYLAASIYKNAKYVLADITGTHKAIKALFGQVEIIEKIPEIDSDETIIWNNAPPQNNWTNLKYINPLISKSLKQGNLKQLLSFIEPEVWEDPEKLKSIVSHLKGAVKFLPQQVLDSENLLDAVKDDYMTFSALWNLHYKEQYRENTLIAKSIKEKIFDNADMCLNLLNYSYKVGFLYHFFSDNVKNNPHIIDKLYKDPTEQKLIDLLTPESFEKEENVLRFLRKVPYCHLAGKEYVYKSWINDKDKVISFLNDKDIACMGSFYEFIPQTITKDKEFILACIPKCHDVISDISPEQMKDCDILKSIISAKATKLIPLDILYSIQDKNIIEMAVKDSYSILLSHKAPKEWLLDDDIIACVPGQHLNNLPESIVKNFLLSEENCLHVIESYPEIYKQLSDKCRATTSIAVKLLTEIDDKLALQHLMEFIPKSLWSNKDFCLIAMSCNTEAINFVPAPFFNQKDFLTEFFDRVDSRNIKDKAISLMPIHIQEVLEENNVESNYKDFLNSYLLQKKLNTNLNNKPSTRKTKL